MSKIAQFLPADYKAPSASGNYMKLADGENRFRILTQPVLGWVDWIDNKPVRYEYAKKPGKPHDATKPVKHFWAFVVWNYVEERIQVLEITQSTVRSALQALCEDESWGAPFAYDIKIIKRGQKVDTEYVVNPVPPKKLPLAVQKAFNELPCNLEALFDGGDPFAPGQNAYTVGVFADSDGKKTSAGDTALKTAATLSVAQADELRELIDGCDDAFRQSVRMWMNGPSIGATEYIDIPAQHFDRLKTEAIKKRKTAAVA